MVKGTKRKSGTNHTLNIRVEGPAPTAAIIPANQPAQEVVPVTDNVQLALDRAEKQMYYRNQLLKLIAKQIDPRDIYVYVLGIVCKKCTNSVKPAFQGDGYYCKVCGQIRKDAVEENLGPYLSGSGCRFVLSSAGAKFEDPTIIEKTYEGTEGPYIDFEVWVTVVTADGRCVRTMGNNPTNDDFFAKRWRWICEKCDAITMYKDGGATCPVHGKVKAKKEGYYLSMQEVDIPGVKQKAMTNAWNHAVRDLGFMPTIQNLKDAGVDLSRLKRISFGKTSEENEEFADRLQAAPQSAPAVTNTPEAAGVSKQAPTASNGAKPSQNAAPKPESKVEPPKEDDRAPGGLPQARIPFKIESVKWTPNGRGLAVWMNGKTLYCFDNKKMGEDGEKLFDILVNGVGQEAIVLTKPSTSSGGGKFTNITALLKLGSREWLEDGCPVRQMREPGEEAL